MGINAARRIGKETAAKVGNAGKIKTSFCMQCPCTSAEINLPSETKCKECSAPAKEKELETDFGKKWFEDWSFEYQCYYREFVEKCQTSLDELIAMHNVEITNIKKQS
eukprot:scaffold225470_cov64-Attheya_sp.AAC.3